MNIISAPRLCVFRVVIAFALCFVLNVGLRAQNPVWQQATGIYGGTVNALLAVDDHQLFAGTDVGLYYSSDAGTHWAQRGFKAATVYALAKVDAVIYAGIGYSEEDGFGGVFRSTDGGNIWEHNLETEEVWSFDMQVGRLLVGTANDGLFISTDGASWQQTLKGNSVYAVRSFGEVVLAATDSAVFRSTDGGANWKKNGLSARGNFYCFETSSTTVFAGGDNGLFKSTDQGATWAIAALKGQLINALASDSVRLYIGTDTNGIVTRTHTTGTLTTAVMQSTSVYALALSSAGAFAGTWEDGVFQSTDQGETFSDIDVGFTASVMYCFGSNSSYMFAAGDGIAISGNGGVSWDWLDIYATVYALLCNDQHILAFAEDGLYESVDNGQNWSQNALSGDTLYCACRVASTIYCGSASKGIRSSTDEGANWQATGLSNGTVSAIFAHRSKLFAAMDDGRLMRSDDNAKTWNEVLYDSTAAMQSIAFVDTMLVAGTSGNDVFLSSDEGQNWQHRLLNPILVTNVEQMDVINKDIYAATYGYGVYTSNDAGMNWTAMNDSLGNPYVYAFSHTQSNLLCSTEGQGVWYRKNLSNAVADETTNLELPCSPQPASQFLNIKLPHGAFGNAYFKLFDVHGTLCFSQHCESTGTSTGSIVIDCSALQSGIYEAVLQSNSVQLRTMVAIVH